MSRSRVDKAEVMCYMLKKLPDMPVQIKHQVLGLKDWQLGKIIIACAYAVKIRGTKLGSITRASTKKF